MVADKVTTIRIKKSPVTFALNENFVFFCINENRRTNNSSKSTNQQN